jgi:hypothetical protein
MAGDDSRGGHDRAAKVSFGALSIGIRVCSESPDSALCGRMKRANLKCLGPPWAFPSQGKCAPRLLRYQHDSERLLIRSLFFLKCDACRAFLTFMDYPETFRLKDRFVEGGALGSGLSYPVCGSLTIRVPLPFTAIACSARQRRGADLFLLGRDGPWRSRVALIFSNDLKRYLGFRSVWRDKAEKTSPIWPPYFSSSLR